MTLIEVSSDVDLGYFLQQHNNALITFSAHWCGPCKASKPALEQLAIKYSDKVQFGIIYESDLGDSIHNYNVKAFPTYVLFSNEKEVNRVQGANLVKVEEMVQSVKPAAFGTAGETLGGGGTATLSPEEARAARLAKLGAATTATATEPAKKEEETKPEPMEVDNKGGKKDEKLENKDDVDMKDSNADDEEEQKEEATTDPTANLDPEAIKTLTESMGFALIRAQKGLLYGNGGTVEGAVEWLMQHQDDDNIDEPIPANAGSATVAQSYKCNECGKILSNMANLELHANKTGHSDFEESTQHVKPLTAEEKAAKINEIKELLKLKRAEREEAEKVDHKEREMQRRMMGKEMAKTREQLEAEQRKREAYLRKKEKEEFKRERQRLREELARDKAERAANQGKLSSKLGVDGYKPDGIQYDEDGGENADNVTSSDQAEHKQKKLKADSAKIDEYIKKVSSYRAGGDGGKCLKVLKIYISNIVDNPNEEKFKSINMDNKAFKTKVKPFIGAKNLLLACGFNPNDDGTALLLNDENYNKEILIQTKKKLEDALIAYG